MDLRRLGFKNLRVLKDGQVALVPSYLYLLRSPMRIAIGTSMAAFVWMALVGAACKLYQGVVGVPVAVTLAIGAVAGAIIGAKLVARVKPPALEALFGVLFLYVSLKYILVYVGLSP